MDFSILKLVVEELSLFLPGAKVERVYQGLDGGLYILFHRQGEKLVLLLSFDRGLPRLHLVSTKPAASDSPFGFVLYLRSHLTGARVAGVSLINEDRVAEFSLTRSGVEYRLVFELIGPAPNLILTDSTSVILSVHHPVPPADNLKRPLLQGITYVPPAPRPVRTKAAIDLQSGPQKTGALNAFCPETGAKHPANRGAEIFYTHVIADRTISSLRARLSSVIKKALVKAERRTVAISRDLASAGQADQYRLTGDLILANLTRFARGTEQAELTGYDGRSVLVKLDPKRSAGQNAELYFKKYKKARIGLTIITERLRQAREEGSYLRSALADLDSASDRETHDLIRSELAAKGYIKKEGKGKGNNKPRATEPAYRKVVHGGWEILIGKSAASNDYITLRLARPDDLWLHAEGMPGSHVLIRNPERADIPSDVLMKAAALAAYYSKGRGAGKVSVTYTRAKFVKKPKGANAGTVTLSERRTVMAVPHSPLAEREENNGQRTTEH
jgi:predicted ribosome quality control (RQC) complex YloA/Tae2 family protein